MATYQLCKVVNGEKGYIPVHSNSHGWIDVGRLDNDTQVRKITSIPAESGFVQIDGVFLPPGIAKSPTGEYWVQSDKLEPVVQPPAPDEWFWVPYDWKFENGQLYLKKKD